MLHRVKAIRTRFEASFWSDSLEHGLNIIHFGGLTLQSGRAPILRIYTNPSPIFLTLILGSWCVVKFFKFADHESVSCSPVVHSCVCGHGVGGAGRGGEGHPGGGPRHVHQVRSFKVLRLILFKVLRLILFTVLGLIFPERCLNFKAHKKA